MTLLERAPAREHRAVSTLPDPSRRISARWVVFWILSALYAALTLGVLVRSPVIEVDRTLFRLDLYDRQPGLWPFINTYVMLGQRAPVTFAALPWIAWRCWRMRARTPLLRLLVALIVLNLSVGVVKVFVGRNGPLHTPNAHDVFAGGNIYPSGHTSNAVVMFGLLAWMAVRHRRAAIAAAVFVPLTVGLCTIYLDTHWFSDVVGGWLAGALVLLVLPSLMPPVERAADAVVRQVRRLRSWPVPPVEDEIRPDPASFVRAGRAPVAPDRARAGVAGAGVARAGAARSGAERAGAAKAGAAKAGAARVAAVRAGAAAGSVAADSANRSRR
jgi:membrane-associated phospholipid phosphatase